jgi:hypothetical protein
MVNGKENVLIEGSIGNLMQANFVEGVILEVVGENGTVRLDLQEKEIGRSKVTF